MDAAIKIMRDCVGRRGRYPTTLIMAYVVILGMFATSAVNTPQLIVNCTLAQHDCCIFYYARALRDSGFLVRGNEENVWRGIHRLP